MRDATLCFLVQGRTPERVLLGYKKRGFGEGKYTGFGGKVQEGETIRKAALRELFEETGISVQDQDLEPMGRLTFLFPARPDWNQAVHVFVTNRWKGFATESDEMRPEWFGTDEIPYEAMWQDAAYWLPHILAGKKTLMQFTFEKDNETIRELEIEE